MRPTVSLLQHAIRVTLFTRQNCSLCDDAKLVLSKVWDKRPFEYSEIDVMKPEGRAWKDLYVSTAQLPIASFYIYLAEKVLQEFDTPVVSSQLSRREEFHIGS